MHTTQPGAGGAPSAPPPFGSWARTYALVCVLALAVMAALYAFTACYQIRLEGP